MPRNLTALQAAALSIWDLTVLQALALYTSQLPDDWALERVASGETDPIEMADHDAPGCDQGRFRVRHLVRPAVLPHKLTHLPQVRSRHAREQVVFDLVVESAHQRSRPPTTTDIA